MLSSYSSCGRYHPEFSSTSRKREDGGMAIPAQHPEPADAAARRAVEPVTVYTVDKLPALDRTFYETVRYGPTLVDTLTVPPRDGRAFEVPASPAGRGPGGLAAGARQRLRRWPRRRLTSNCATRGYRGLA